MKRRIASLLALLGPGWIVMMADVDAPSVLTGIQSGIHFNGHMVLFLLLLTIPLFIVQNTASKISAIKGKSLGNIISENYGHSWTVLVVISMAIIDFAAYVGEFAGIGAAGLIFGIPIYITIIATLVLHTGLIFTGSYKRVEKILIAFSGLLFLFIIIDLFVHPPHATISDLNPFVGSKSFLYLIAANIGAVIMPWMIYYQMSANVEKGVTEKNLKNESRETLFGALVSEVLMIAIVIFAWAIPKTSVNGSDLVVTVSSYINTEAGALGSIFFGIALWAAGLLALIVVSISLSYALSDGLKIKGGLNNKFSIKDPFYIFYVLEIIPAGLLVLFYKNLVSVALNIMVFNVFAVAIPLVFIVRVSTSKKIMGNFTLSKPWKYSIYASLLFVFFFGVFSIV